MYVRNIAVYNFAFNYRDTVIYIPADGKIYSIPDDSGTYSELKVVMPMHVRTQPVTYINKDGNVASENILGHKRRGRPTREESRHRRRSRHVPTSTTDICDSSVVDIDIDEELICDSDNIPSPKSKPIPKRPAKRAKPRKKNSDI